MSTYSSLKAYVVGVATGVAIGAVVATNYPEQTKLLFSRVTDTLAEEYRLARKMIGCEDDKKPDKIVELEKRVELLEKEEEDK